MFDGMVARAWFFELHRFVSLFLVAVVLFHALIMLPDPYADFALEELLIPFRSDFKPVAMALGILSLYGIVLLSASFFVTRWIGQKSWRLLHYATFLTFVAGTVHGVWIGTDTGDPTVRLGYLALAVVLVFLIFYRILAARSVKRRAVPVQRPVSASPEASGLSAPADLGTGQLT
jgi:predicted ferric reductase